MALNASDRSTGGFGSSINAESIDDDGVMQILDDELLFDRDSVVDVDSETPRATSGHSGILELKPCGELTEAECINDLRGSDSDVLDNLQSTTDSSEHEPRSQSRPSYAGLRTARTRSSLAASRQINESLQELARTAQFLSAAVRSACGASSRVVEELTTLDSDLLQQSDDHQGLVARIAELEEQVRDTQRHARDERQALMEQQDAFIAALISDHERSMQTLKARLAQVESELAASRAVAAE